MLRPWWWWERSTASSMCSMSPSTGDRSATGELGAGIEQAKPQLTKTELAEPMPKAEVDGVAGGAGVGGALSGRQVVAVVL